MIVTTLLLAVITVAAVNAPEYEAVEDEIETSEPVSPERPETSEASSASPVSWVLTGTLVAIMGVLLWRYLTLGQAARLVLLVAGAMLLVLLIGQLIDLSQPPPEGVRPEAVEEAPADSPAGRSGLPVVVLVVIAAGAALAIIALARRQTTSAAEPDDEELDVAIRIILDDLESIADDRDAVISAYARLEAALGDLGFERWREETSREFLARVLSRTDSHRAAIGLLGDLYEHARFDSAPVSAEQRRTAIAALHAFRPRADSGRR